jgi:hypothetical protein
MHTMFEVADTVLLAAPPNASPADGQSAVLVADAIDGHPVEGARVRLVRWDFPKEKTNGILHWEETAFTGADGVVCLPWHVRTDEVAPYYECLWIAEGPGDRFVATKYRIGYGLRQPRVWRPGSDSADLPVRTVAKGNGSILRLGTEPLPENARGAPVPTPADAATLSLSADPDAVAPGDAVRLRLRAARPNSWVLLTTRAGTERAESHWIHLDGNTADLEFETGASDAPNVFVEALAFHDGRMLLSVAGIAVAPPGTEDPGWHWSYHPRRGCSLDQVNGVERSGRVYITGDSPSMPRLFDFPRSPPPATLLE